MATRLAPEVRVLFAPWRTYAELRDAGASGWAWLRRPALVALVISVAVGIGATRSVDLTLLVGLIACWSFVPALQVGLAALLVASTPARQRGLRRGIDLVFVGHVPWSLWALGVGAWFSYGAPGTNSIYLGSTAAVAGVWRAVLLLACCEAALGLSRPRAVGRVLLHQAGVVALILAYLAWATGLLVRIAAWT